MRATGSEAGAASCCWTGPRTTTTPPRRLATSATVQLLRLSRATRTVMVRPVDPDMACRPPVGLGPVSPHAPLSGLGPPAAGTRSGMLPTLQLIPDTARQPQGPDCARVCRLGCCCCSPGWDRMGTPSRWLPRDGLLGHLTLCPPVCRPRDRVAADPSLPTRGCQLPTQLSDGCGSSRPSAPGVVTCLWTSTMDIVK